MRIRARWLGLIGFGLAACTGGSGPVDVVEDTPAADVVSDEPVANDAMDAATDATATIDAIDAEPDGSDMDGGVDALVDVYEPDVLPPLDVQPSDAGSVDGEVVLPNVCTGNDIAIASLPGESRFPVLVWNGSEYGVVWQDNVDDDWEIHFARIGADSTVLDGEVRVTTEPGDDIDPTVAWDGHHYVVAWTHATGAATGGASIRTAMITHGSDGGAWNVGAPNTVNDVSLDFADSPVIEAIASSAGGGFGVVWEDGRNGPGNHEIYYSALDATGARHGSNVRVTQAGRLSYSPVMHWNTRRNELGVLWLDDRDGTGSSPNEELYFARLTPAGAHVSGTSDVRVTDDQYRSLWPSFTYDATGLAIAWANESDIPDRPHVFFTQRDDSGMPRAGGVESLAISRNPPEIGAWTTAVGWNGSEYLVVWEDQRHRDGDLVVRRVSANGSLLTDEVFLGDDTEFTGHPSLVWTGADWAMTWEDDRNDHRDPFFRALARDACLN